MRTALGCIIVIFAIHTSTVAATLNGTVVDESGRPVIGGRVDIATAAPKIGRGMFCPSCYIDCAKSTKTDDEGRFSIKKLDPTLKFRVLFTAVGKEAHITDLTDPAKDELNVALKNVPADMPPERTVRGRVVNDLGIPIEGALIEPEGAKTAARRWWGRVDGVKVTVSDAKGYFAMLLPADFEGVDLTVSADGHAGAQAALLPPGNEEHKIIVPVGTKVTGRIEHNAAPVAGLGVAVVQMERTAGTHFIQAVHATTNALGEFVFEYLPPDQQYAIFTPIPGNDSGLVLSTKKFKAYGNHKVRDLGALEARSALRLAGRLTPPPGQPVPADVKMTLGRDPAWDLVPIEVDSAGNFQIDGLPPESYTVRLSADTLQLDTAELNHQSLGANAFGLRVDKSIDGLRIPLRPAPPAKTAQQPR